ncbi:hypothetical protein [Pararhodonellum marinum]|uniref:hypothetical protein n=1 Tax=Pararhodonellum marinum TaxID=2755358 RepID=UPI00188F6ACC|nr:hypothetical protein [Pararhodonellum marinum]
MAKKYQDIDELFREKLIGHEENPSALAWEKLDSQLPPPKSSRSPFPLGIAASLILIAAIGFFIWTNSGQNDLQQTDQLVNQEEVIQSEDPKSENENIAELPEKAEPKPEKESNKEDESADKKEQPNPAVRPNIQKALPKPVPTLEENNPLLAEKEAEEKTERETNEPIQVIIPELPELNQENTIAEQTSPTIPEEEEVTYRVRIVSNGIAAEAPKETLAEEINEKIDKIGGLLNKVDQGFADLQDAKNNLFASIITNNKEKTK